MKVKILSENCCYIYHNCEVWLQSYDSIIAKKIGDKVILDERYWEYSATTSKRRCQFLNETKAETVKKIKSGEYTLTNLN